MSDISIQELNKCFIEYLTTKDLSKFQTIADYKKELPKIITIIKKEISAQKKKSVINKPLDSSDELETNKLDHSETNELDLFNELSVPIKNKNVVKKKKVSVIEKPINIIEEYNISDSDSE